MTGTIDTREVPTEYSKRLAKLHGASPRGHCGTAKLRWSAYGPARGALDTLEAATAVQCKVAASPLLLCNSKIPQSID